MQRLPIQTQKRRETIQKRMAKFTREAKKNLGLSNEEVQSIIETAWEKVRLERAKKNDDKDALEKLEEDIEFQRYGALGDLSTTYIQSLFEIAEQEIGFTKHDIVRVLKGAGTCLHKDLEDLTHPHNIGIIKEVQKAVGIEKDDIVSILEGSTQNGSKIIKELPMIVMVMRSPENIPVNQDSIPENADGERLQFDDILKELLSPENIKTIQGLYDKNITSDGVVELLKH